MKREIVITEDGSKTLYVPELDEHYHSTFGAVQESMHVFIEAGLNQIQQSDLSIFELGYGTGLNCILTYLNAGKKSIRYKSIEKYPLTVNEILNLNYPEALTLDEQQKNAVRRIDKTPWSNEVREISTTFRLSKINIDIRSFNPEETFNLIYFDAFAPDIQPDLWSPEIFEKMFSSLCVGGILVTYCAKGAVRRIMQSCGFQTERIPGPPGKREMLRATKK